MDDHHASIDRLISRDPALAAVVERAGRPARFRRPPTLATLVLLILEQQVSLASAAAAYRRLEEAGPVDPELIRTLDDAALRSIGFSRQKTRYVRALAAAVETGTLDPAGLGRLSDEDARTALLAIPGIGEWTADIFLLSSLGRPDVWPVGDRALQVGTRDVLGLDQVPSRPELMEIGLRWAPFRSTAALLVWHDYLSRRRRTTG